ncbi:glycine hydroxymethyltransferase [Dactylosporangium sp. CA-139114]|uniref:glycine hydroxymethyltransferase n=1 Tax=Dactylosporangium sp. CA-139114 TaxID=3239931 RepID=UPI003D967749
MRYLAGLNGRRPDPAALAFYASLDQIASTDPAVARSIVSELADQRANIKLIASENFSSQAVQLAQGNLFTDKYAEGAVGHRFYAGCDNVDAVEAHAADLAKQLFQAEHAYLQPHSGIDANLVAFLAILTTRVENTLLTRLSRKNVSALDDTEWEQLRTELVNQRLLGMDYYSGGHLTHGYRFNVSARLFDARTYTVDPVTKLLDLDALRAQVQQVRPLILLAGYSAYTRLIDFARLREIADEVGAVLMVDMAHFAGLVAGKVFTGVNNPVPYAHVVTSTTHKTLRGPRGGLVLCVPEFADAVDKGCPTVLGGPLPHAIAAKAVALREALQPSFADYAHRIVDNARTLAEQLQQRKVEVVTGGTDNHIVLADVTTTYGLTGRQAESALRSVGITLNRNSLPFDENGPWYTSGLRLGTPAITTLGMDAAAITEIADVIVNVLSAVQPAAGDNGTVSKAKYSLDEGVAEQARGRLSDLAAQYQLYPEIDLDIIGDIPDLPSAA